MEHTPDIAEGLGGEGFRRVEERLRGGNHKLSRVSLGIARTSALTWS